MNKSFQSSHKRSLVLSAVFCLTLLISSSTAQITIPQSGFSNWLTAGKSFSYYQADSVPEPLNIGKREGPQVYDFNAYKFQSSGISHVYSVGTIPTLAARYLAGALIFGSTADSIENNPVFLFAADTLYVLGKASLVPQRRFQHNRPYEPVAIFPVTYQSVRTYSHAHYDTTFNTANVVIATDRYDGSDSLTVDGFGTLKILGLQFECLRVKLNHYTFSDKEFLFLTREGLFFMVEMKSSQADTGLIQPTSVALFIPSSLVTVDEHVHMPSTSVLEQNYPNPFNPTTTISFSLPSRLFASLKVFDALGRQVSTVISEELPAGTFSRQWDAGALPSGLYFYRLQAGQYSETKGMLLLR